MEYIGEREEKKGKGRRMEEERNKISEFTDQKHRRAVTISKLMRMLWRKKNEIMGIS